MSLFSKIFGKKKTNIKIEGVINVVTTLLEDSVIMNHPHREKVVAKIHEVLGHLRKGDLADLGRAYAIMEELYVYESTRGDCYSEFHNAYMNCKWFYRQESGQL
jgi:hypothetical protein